MTEKGWGSEAYCSTKSCEVAFIEYRLSRSSIEASVVDSMGQAL